MDKKTFISDVLAFSDNNHFYKVCEDYQYTPGVAFMLKTDSDVAFVWRDYEIETMPETMGVDIGYCLARALSLREEARRKERIKYLKEQKNG